MKKLNSLEFPDEYDEKQRSKILNVVNKQSVEEMANYNISKQRIMKIDKRKQMQGEFKSVNEILELDGFGVKVLEKFCESIIAANDEHKEMIVQKQAKAAKAKALKVVSPPLSNFLRQSITSCVSFHVDVNHIAWTKLTFGANKAVESSSVPVSVDEWACHAIGNEGKKPSLSDLIQTLVYLNGKIPKADVYVVESQQTPRPATQPGNAIQMTINVQKAQVLAMISVLMASREGKVFENERDLHETISEEAQQTLFFLKNFISSRLYKTLVGTERVATDQVIEHILRCNEGIENPNNRSLSAIDVPLHLRKQFADTLKLDREFIGQATLNGLAFFKLCVLRCHESAAIVNYRNDESD